MTNEIMSDTITNVFATILATHGERKPYQKVADFVKKFDSNTNHANIITLDDFGCECEYWSVLDYLNYFMKEFDEEFGTTTCYLDSAELMEAFNIREDGYFDYKNSGEWVA